MVISGSDGVTFPDSTNQFSGGAFSFKNRIINGDMRIDQRNAGASLTVNDAAAFYAVDRFECQGQSGDGVYTAQRSTTVPAGFNNSLAITVTTADASIGATQSYMIRQRIEGFNVADLGFGSANAKTVTISFWVRSSLTGTFGGALINGSFNRAYPFSYTISAADTWEQKSVTIAGDTTGTWNTDNSTGFVVSFSLGAGSSRVGTAGAWAGSNLQGATGQVNLIGTNGATFFLTGVQLEVGSVATPFERRPYGTELYLCQRYFYKTDALGVGPANTADAVVFLQSFPQVMRAAPTTTAVAGTNWTISDNYTTDYTATSPTILNVYQITTTSVRTQLGGFSGLTTGRWYSWLPSASTSSISFSAEL
jgi:hypothetical protein